MYYKSKNYIIKSKIKCIIIKSKGPFGPLLIRLRKLGGLLLLLDVVQYPFVGIQLH